ncbi:MAG: septation regulator SpoVG [Treponema sp.]
MEITDVRIRKCRDKAKLKAYASVTFDDCFVVHSIGILEGSNGLFVVMPSRKVGEDEFKNIAHPIVTSFREKMSKAVLDAYKAAKDEE